jgi:hypothetical protein
MFYFLRMDPQIVFCFHRSCLSNKYLSIEIIFIHFRFFSTLSLILFPRFLQIHPHNPHKGRTWGICSLFFIFPSNPCAKTYNCRTQPKPRLPPTQSSTSFESGFYTFGIFCEREASIGKPEKERNLNINS